jgi:CRISPR-associated protein Cas2
MPERRLHLVGYDVADPRRLARALKVARNYATGGQLSVHECFLTAAEKRALWLQMREVIDPKEDRVFILRLDPRAPVRTLGIGLAPEDPPFFYHG